MENKQNIQKVAIYIGRFAPLHKGHKEIINFCENNYDQSVYFIGSANKRRTIKNPFPIEMIEKWINETIIENHIFRNTEIIKSKIFPINDYIYNDNKWIAQIEDILYRNFDKNTTEFHIVGHNKDDSSYYLKIFPRCKVVELPSFADGISATTLRNYMFNNEFDKIEKHVSLKVFNDIQKFIKTEEFLNLQKEDKYFKNEEEKFKDYPYPETLKFNCSDAVVVCDGNILLVQRGAEPGKGVWAIPGGFVNRKETYKDCAIRELFEETNLKVPSKVLNGSFKRSHIFDSIKRNDGIPRISNAFYFEIQPDFVNGFPKLPKVRGADDATDAQWFSLAEVRHMILFDDHQDIIDYFVNSI